MRESPCMPCETTTVSKDKKRQSGNCLLWLLSVIWQYVAGALQQVVSEEETPEWVLDTTAHLN